MKSKLYVIINIALLILSFIIIADYTLPGKIVSDKIESIKREKQQYYNAAGNSHNSYTIITNNYDFSISKDFALKIKNNEKIKFSISRIFKKINWYSAYNSSKKERYSLRVVSGFVIPLIFIIVFIASNRFKRKIEILFFVNKVVLIGNIIFLTI